MPQAGAQTKTLIFQAPGKTGVLVSDHEPELKTFPDAHKALTWCELNGAVFYYLPPAPVAKN